MRKIQDAGQKLGGARKDLWAGRGLSWSDTDGMTDPEKARYVNRENIWPKEKCDGGLSDDDVRLLSFWRNSIRTSMMPTPGSAEDAFLKRYVDGISRVKEEALKVDDPEKISAFYDEMADGIVMRHVSGRFCEVVPEFRGVCDGKKFLKYCTINPPYSLKRDMDKAGYGLTPEEKIRKDYKILKCPDEASVESYGGSLYLARRNGCGTDFFHGEESELAKLADYGQAYALVGLSGSRLLAWGTKDFCDGVMDGLVRTKLAQGSAAKAKSRPSSARKRWLPPQLKDLKREGPNYRLGADVTGEQFLKAFGLRGVEFGNYGTAVERQEGLNMSYDAFMDMSRILSCERTDLSFQEPVTGSLGLGLYSRGHSSAIGTYEPAYKAINITKRRGPGSLGHEMGHALDDFMAKQYGITSGLASERLGELQKADGYPKKFAELVRSLAYDGSGGRTDFYRDAIAFDASYTKTANGYWSSYCEMFARAFACYLLDRASELGIRNDWLNGHAESGRLPDGRTAYPRGEERKEFDRKFDEMISELKEIELLHDHDWSEGKLPPAFDPKDSSSITYGQDCCGQFCLPL